MLVAPSSSSSAAAAALSTTDVPVEAQWTFQSAPAPAGPYDPWLVFNDSGSATGVVQRDSSTAFNGQASASIQYTSGTGLLGYANRGLGREGLFLEGGKDYEGYFFAKADAAVDITVRLNDYTTSPPTVLATNSIAFKGGNWTMLNFTLTPDVGTTCEDGSQDENVM